MQEPGFIHMYNDYFEFSDLVKNGVLTMTGKTVLDNFMKEARYIFKSNLYYSQDLNPRSIGKVVLHGPCEIECFIGDKNNTAKIEYDNNIQIYAFLNRYHSKIPHDENILVFNIYADEYKTPDDELIEDELNDYELNDNISYDLFY